MIAPSTANEAEWFAVMPLADGVTRIHETHIAEFYRCNIWHVRGRDRCLLFDSGLGVVSLVGQCPWLAETPILAVASHTHFDHIGNHHEFSERACHPSEAGILSSPDSERTLASVYARAEMFERLPPGGFDEARYTVRPAPATRLIEEGDVIDLGNRHFHVLHAPGHSPGSIALFERATGLLLSGDAIYDGPLIDDAYHSNTDEYVATMRRLGELKVHTVHGGHYPSFGRDRFRVLIDEYLAGHRQPGCPAETRNTPVR
ncbi:MAG: MBL fold metallo-hydrolase [Gammaproteobacteria bacterium]|nr:MBL fold metallo-hydrolase [Gammaproteobacteria bacterium]